jgi:hypothetical protein
MVDELLKNGSIVAVIELCDDLKDLDFKKVYQVCLYIFNILNFDFFRCLFIEAGINKMRS